MSGFWLSHHSPAEYGRCFRFGSVAVCARCLGTYPVLIVALLAQFVLHVPLAHWADAWCIAAVVPALGDWAHGRFRPDAGSNALRFVTGVLLGLGLSRSLFIHLQRPLPAVLWWQFVVISFVVLPVILVSYLRRSGR